MVDQTNVFALNEDLLPGLESFDSNGRVGYFPMGVFETAPTQMLSSLLLHDGLGVNRSGSHIAGDSFLVVPSSQQLVVRQIHTRRHGIRFAVDQEANPDSIVFRPPGLYDSQTLIVGHITTTARSRESLELLRDFSVTLTKGFSKIRGYKIGPRALEFLRSGNRLVTISIRTPREYDFRD